MSGLGTRAVPRVVEPGVGGWCASLQCPTNKGWIKFEARKKNTYVICNVYEGDKWDRIELYHPNCYEREGSPHGPLGE